MLYRDGEQLDIFFSCVTRTCRKSLRTHVWEKSGFRFSHGVSHVRLRGPMTTSSAPVAIKKRAKEEKETTPSCRQWKRRKCPSGRPLRYGNFIAGTIKLNDKLISEEVEDKRIRDVCATIHAFISTSRAILLSKTILERILIFYGSERGFPGIVDLNESELLA